MATLRDYFETDFPSTATVRYELSARLDDKTELDTKIVAHAHIDLAAHVKFCSFYLPNTTEAIADIAKGVLAFARDVLALRRGQAVTLPKMTAAFSGCGIHLCANEYLDVALAPLEGGTFDVRDFSVAPPIYIYTEQELSPELTNEITDIGRRHNSVMRIRGPKYAMERADKEHPVAFISHDSRDKDEIARPLALGLSRLQIPVWFDEFTLKPGDRLRESIEKGIKECKKCVLVLTPNFLTNSGWGQTEFNSIFSREILEERALVVPVWAGVTKEQVFEYSPSLINVLGAIWETSDTDKAIKDVARGLVT